MNVAELISILSLLPYNTNVLVDTRYSDTCACVRINYRPWIGDVKITGLPFGRVTSISQSIRMLQDERRKSAKERPETNDDSISWIYSITGDRPHHADSCLVETATNEYFVCIYDSSSCKFIARQNLTRCFTATDVKRFVTIR